MSSLGWALLFGLAAINVLLIASVAAVLVVMRRQTERMQELDRSARQFAELMHEVKADVEAEAAAETGDELTTEETASSDASDDADRNE